MLSKKTTVKDALRLGEPCKKCGHCCKFSSGILAQGDLKEIADFIGVSEEVLKNDFLEEAERFNKKVFKPKLERNNKPYGVCVFFEDGCKIHDVKPFQCKVNNCSEHGEELSLWFMLNYLIDVSDPEAIRQFADYLKSGGKTLPGGELRDYIADEEKLTKILKFEVLR